MSYLTPFIVAAGANATINPAIYAAYTILRTEVTLNVLGTARVERNLSVLIAIKLFIVIKVNVTLIYRTVLQGQPLWNTSYIISTEAKGTEIEQESMSERAKLFM